MSAEVRRSSRELVAELERRFSQAEAIAARDDRADARAYVSDHLARQRAARVLDEQRAEREAIRSARADAHDQDAAQSATDHALGKRADVEQLAARRRDQYRRSLAYPASGDEILQATAQALDDAGLPDGDDRDETYGLLNAHVIRRLGPSPLRADLGRIWLRDLARWIWQRERDRRERATGLQASAALVSQWEAESDSDSDSGPDAVWWIAANLPAPDQADALDAEHACKLLGLTGKQADALTRTLEVQQRTTAALSGAERKRAADARAAVRKVYPDADSIRYALRPNLARAAAVDQAGRIERQRATVAGRGSHLPGGALDMARPMVPIFRPNDQRLSRADRVWTYGLTARDDRAARND